MPSNCEMHVAVWALPDDNAAPVPVATGYHLINFESGRASEALEWISLVDIASTAIQGLLLVSISPVTVAVEEWTNIQVLSPLSPFLPAVERAAERLHLRNDLLELSSLLEPLRRSPERRRQLEARQELE